MRVPLTPRAARDECNRCCKGQLSNRPDHGFKRTGWLRIDARLSGASMRKLLSVIVTTANRRYVARSLTTADVADLAQWAQQKKRPPTSTPCPITLHLQCSQMGAIAWIAHSRLSKVCRVPAAISTKLLSYSLPQTSHVAIPNLLQTAPTERTSIAVH